MAEDLVMPFGTTLNNDIYNFAISFFLIEIKIIFIFKLVHVLEKKINNRGLTVKIIFFSKRLEIQHSNTVLKTLSLWQWFVL